MPLAPPQPPLDPCPKGSYFSEIQKMKGMTVIIKHVLESLQRCTCLNPCMPTRGESTKVPTPAPRSGPGTCHDWSVLVTQPKTRAWPLCSDSGRAVLSVPQHLQNVCVQGFMQTAGRNQRLPTAWRLPIPPAPGILSNIHL